MSKINVGNKVRIKATNEIGTVMGREVKELSDKKVLVEYVVKTGTGFDTYKAYTRKEIERYYEPVEENNANKKTYPRVYNYEHQCDDGRVLVMTGIVDTFTEWHCLKGNIKTKYLSVGYAICHPSDDNDREVGAEIAYRRAEHKPLAYFETPFTGEFRPEFVTDILISKALFVEKNIDRFIERDRN